MNKDADWVLSDKSGKKQDAAAVSTNKIVSPVDEDARSGLARMLDAHMSDMGTILNGILRFFIRYDDSIFFISRPEVVQAATRTTLL